MSAVHRTSTRRVTDFYSYTNGMKNDADGREGRNLSDEFDLTTTDKDCSTYR